MVFFPQPHLTVLSTIVSVTCPDVCILGFFNPRERLALFMNDPYDKLI